ncbi:hypothetical protein BDN72DRAFT_101394 [Pluteus cervinus]|uniref:Uncharacterized protein n=1 Tax=Pluteus cervinus TaxID=181527 RepID=A0ACD3B7L5_9AGAR|nr:hypothetical protein BDN72DRAFT_101394 [Pluteus cervinus]
MRFKRSGCHSNRGFSLQQQIHGTCKGSSIVSNANGEDTPGWIGTWIRGRGGTGLWHIRLDVAKVIELQSQSRSVFQVCNRPTARSSCVYEYLWSSKYSPPFTQFWFDVISVTSVKPPA